MGARTNFSCLLMVALALASWQSACADEFENLVVDKTLDGWEVRPSENTSDHWKIEQEMIVGENVNKVGSDLWTKKDYHDYELELEFMTPSEYYDTGVFLRGSSHQVQIGISGSLKIDLTACIYAPIDKLGSYPAKSDKVAAVNKPGQWNHLRIVLTGKRVQTFLNQVPFVDYECVALKDAGPIGLQLHAGHHMKIFFRNIKLKDLSPG